MKLSKLDRLVRDICPIDGLSLTGQIWFKEEATQQQRDNATALVNQHIGSLTSQHDDTPSSARVLADVLISKGVLTQQEIDTIADEGGVVFYQK